MKRLHKGFGMGSLAVCAVLLTQSHCTDAPSNGNMVGADGGTDMATVVQPQDPPSTVAITSVNPPRLAQAVSTVLAIGGTGFKQGATVTVGGVTCASPQVSQVNYTGTLITCTIPAQPKTCGNQAIVVTNPDATTANNNTLFLRYPASPSFAARTPLSTGSTPFTILAPDINGDAKRDLVYVQRGASNIAVRIGNGDGTFNATVNTFATGGSQPIELGLADFDGDNNADIVVSNFGSNNVGVLRGNGMGSFGAATTFTGTNMVNPHGVATADINGDGKMDAVVTNYGSNSVQPLLGDGTGKLTAQNTIPVGTQPSAVALADLNGDGKLDFVSSDSGSFAMSIRLGNGVGGFSGNQTLQNGTGSGTVRILDVNQDNQLDIVNSGAGAYNKVNLFFGNGTGVFGTPASYTVGAGPGSVAVADINRDGILDLIVAGNGAANITILLGDGMGNFVAVPGATTFAVGTQPIGVVATDLNGDGSLDIVTADAGSSTLSILLANDQCK